MLHCVKSTGFNLCYIVLKAQDSILCYIVLKAQDSILCYIVLKAQVYELGSRFQELRL